MCKAIIKGKRIEYRGEFRAHSAMDSSVAGVRRSGKVFINYSRNISSKTNPYIKK